MAHGCSRSTTRAPGKLSLKALNSVRSKHVNNLLKKAFANQENIFDRFRGASGARIDQLGEGQPEATQIPGPMPVNRMHSQQITPVSSIVENPYVIVD